MHAVETSALAPASTWRARADAALYVTAPAPARGLAEVGLVVALVLGGHLAALSPWLGGGLAALEAALAIGLVWPWLASGSPGRRAVVVAISLAAVLVPLVAQGPLGGALAKEHIIVATALRDFVLIAFLLLLARVDGQPLTALGLAREGTGTELKVAVPATVGVFLVQVAAAVPIALLASLLHAGEREAKDRIDTLSHLSGQASIPSILASLVVAAAFEEVCFRAFLTPRVRTLTGSWGTAALVVSALFGLGHVYEGTIAIAQTAILGLYFTAVFLWRRRLLAGVVAHATFNAVMFLVIRVLMQGGLIERLKAMAAHS